mmetsp:Transcript_27373/g.37756  ORF Transcript_27373/g.37756 Transcript_27373/m.37756 type:complete len:596 (-) Transcript_27373:131-1918(-)|eukprot:CAMPEP_0196572456 /NCGR_PEP_ID=MMETSP1081-20130531/2507_1 /TAXON_ID=36882 /ORGANISM="Pyramimonas amylifera, Strain CCMP720" /LENGTH=595 /DNA_ID=CAMNT_0041889791 /DNA_START=189 /DNA_END=1976 /DNA_ORIENTATION=-
MFAINNPSHVLTAKAASKFLGSRRVSSVQVRSRACNNGGGAQCSSLFSSEPEHAKRASHVAPLQVAQEHSAFSKSNMATSTRNPNWVSTQLREGTWDEMKSRNKIRKTKIVCTIGPSSWERESLFALAAAGMNIARLNMSHGDYESHKKVVDLVKEYNLTSGNAPIGILLDTKGPEVRSGDLKTPIDLKPGMKFTFTIDYNRPLGEYETTVNYDNFVKDVSEFDIILVDAGMQSLQVTKVTEKDVECVVLEGGMFKSRRHLNVRGTTADLPSITQKDWADLKFGVEQGVDFYALSFVHDAETILEVKEFLRDNGAGHALVLPKIESSRAARNLSAIISAADGAMVARGDLGAELPVEEVPLIQSEIVAKCNRQGKPVIVATNMLESMIECPCPTRAEVADITVAVREGTDCVMLSGETANGKHPVKAVQTMATVAKRIPWDLAQHPLTEFDVPARFLSKERVVPGLLQKDALLGEMFAYNACSMANLQEVPIVVFTESGYTAKVMSHFRPRGAIFAFTPSKQIARMLSIYRGVTAFPIAPFSSEDMEEIFEECLQHLVALDLVQKDTNICLVTAKSNFMSGEDNGGNMKISFRNV